MKTRAKTNIRHGIALITVLFIVMAASIIALGIIVRSDMELACGNNMTIHMKMDCLAQSALTHAKTLLMYPQDAPTSPAGYWLGDMGLQIDTTGNDCYDIVVTQSGAGPTRRLDYRVVASAYRLVDGWKTAKCNLTANVHLDPCITYWQGLQNTIPAEVAIYGDAYFDDNITILGYIDGDVYAKLAVTDAGTITGNIYESVASPPVPLPSLAIEDFNTDYYIGIDKYSVDKISPKPGSETLNVEPSPSNPAGVCYCSGSIELEGNCLINGTLVVNNDLTLTSTCNLDITAQKNFPALIVGGSLIVDANDVSAGIFGLVQITNRIDMQNKIGATMDLTGALYVLGDGIINTTGSAVNVTTDPVRAAIKTDSAVDSTLWTPVGDAIYKSIQ